MKHHTKEEKREILDALKEGRTMQDVTKAYDVSYASIRRWRLEEGELDKPRQSYTLKEKAEILIRIEEDKLSDAEAAGIADVNKHQHNQDMESGPCPYHCSLSRHWERECS